MSEKFFSVKKHQIPCQHIREYPGATAEPEDTLYLDINQYTPLSNPDPKKGDITIIAGTGIGFPKECYEIYEPLWDAIIQHVGGARIRGIWIADTYNQGASGVLNEGKIGNDPCWDDHARDLLFMINTFRKEIPQPIFGIGHSLGAYQLARLSLLHPQLLSSLVLIDPVIQPHFPATTGPDMALNATFRKDIWPSREAASAYFKKAFKLLDPGVVDRFIRFGLRDTPTALYPANSTPAGSVTLTTTKHQEAFTILRSNFNGKDGDGNLIVTYPSHADINLASKPVYPFYRPESVNMFAMLPHIRPSVLYIFGADSPVSLPKYRRSKVERTGTGIGGSGGVERGTVAEVVVDGCGHLVSLQSLGIEACAKAITLHLEKEVARYQEETARRPVSRVGELAVCDEEWKRRIVDKGWKVKDISEEELGLVVNKVNSKL